MQGLHIALAAEPLFYVWGIPITNALITTWVIVAFLVVMALLVGSRVKLIPGKVQNAFELLFEFVYGYVEETLGTPELAKRFFPLIMSIFLFIFASNLFEFLPFSNVLGFTKSEGWVELFRPAATDLNVTLALAVISYLVIEITGIVVLGFLRYGSKFVNFRGGVLGFLVGLIEFVSNLARLISFSFRLFGNIFAGGVLVALAVGFLPVILPVPLMLFETFVALVQAAIFALLTLAFIKIAISEPHGGEEHAKGSH